MRRSRDLFWLVGLLFLIAISVSYAMTPPPPPPQANEPVKEDFYLCLEIFPSRDYQTAYYLDVVSNRSETSWLSRFSHHRSSLVQNRGTRVSMTAAQLETLRASLEQADIWNLKDGDSVEKESDVLYTRLTVISGSRESRTQWRGLPGPHGKVARVLLDGPWGDSLRQGLKAIEERKARMLQRLRNNRCDL